MFAVKFLSPILFNVERLGQTKETGMKSTASGSFFICSDIVYQYYKIE